VRSQETPDGVQPGVLSRLQPRLIVVLLLIALGASCRDTPPDVPAPEPWGTSSRSVAPRCSDAIVDIDEPPDRVDQTISDLMAPQPTLKGMADAADAIVVGSIVGERFHLSPECFPSTLVTIALDHVIKDHPRVGAPGERLVVWRFGGKRREGDIVVREEDVGFPSFKVGERFLLLLSWNANLERLYAGLAYNTLKVDGPILKPVGRESSSLIESGRDKELSVFAAELRALIARR